MSIPALEEIIEPNDQTEARKASLAAIADLVGNVYPNKFARTNISGGEDTLTALKQFDKVAEIEAKMAEIKASLSEGERPPADKKDALNEELKALGTVRIAGRLTTPTRGNFVHLTDGMSKLQVYANKKGPLALVKNDGADTIDEENGWALWQLLDHGDLIGVEGYLFITNTGEVSVHVEKLQFLAKAMLPMPDKMHGIADPELRRRYRYADLIASSLQVEHDGLTTREVFERRAKLITGMRRFLDDHGYIEVETPMLTPKATGAAATPFETYHNALDIPLYARIAPELYLKRLTVGGFEKVYEINRNFRNEGLSHKHNPEFTMLEFYCAYMDVNGMMDFCEELMQDAVLKSTGQLQASITKEYAGTDESPIIVDFGMFERLTMKQAIVRYWDKLGSRNMSRGTIDESWLENVSQLRYLATYMRLKKEVILLSDAFETDGGLEKKFFMNFLPKGWNRDRIEEIDKERISLAEEFPSWADELTFSYLENHAPKYPDVEAEKGAIVLELFESFVERFLIQPTFITDYPKSISPLSKADPRNPNVAERFELFINGMEVANGFSELNDPKEQYERFVDQMAQREGGDEEAMVLDEDYIRALSYGMPPAAGIGIGIDRLVMLLTNKHSIRDVILFPHMRPEKREGEKGSEGEGEKEV
ncbi:MAG: lysine--tRNA ligase [Blastocatellia bacterium]|nr:lysine--tRNA ligase [Blastocatellia bacterium]